MTEQLKQELSTLLLESVEATKAGVTQAVEFASAQAPELIQQILIWNFTVSLLGWLLCLILFIGITILGIYIYKNHRDIDNVVLELIYPLIGGILGLVAFVGICANTMWIKIWVAPKLFLLEYAAKLIGS